MTSPSRASRSHTLIGHSTLGRTPLGGWSAPRRDLYLTTHNIHERQTSVPPPGGIRTRNAPTSQRPQTHALDRLATGAGTLCDIPRINIHILSTFKDCNGQRRDPTLHATTTGILEVDFVRSNQTAWHRVQEDGSVRSHRQQYFSFPSTFTFNACFGLFVPFSEWLLLAPAAAVRSDVVHLAACAFLPPTCPILHPRHVAQ